MGTKIIMFMPSIEGGGVEKNFFIISNYLSNFKNISVITISNKYRGKFKKQIKFITYKSEFWDSLGRRTKYFLALILLIKEILKDKKINVFCFQANVYATIICKIFSIKIIIRSNSAPIGWSQNIIKKKMYKFFLNLSDKVLVNSREFKNDIKKNFNVKADYIYNPLNKDEIIKKSKMNSKKIFNKKCLKIISIGRFVDQKDQISLLKALKILNRKNLKFEAALVGKGYYKNKLINYIKLNKLNKKIKIIKFIDNPYPYLRQADLFILTSKYEGLPNVLLEAVTLNKFVISSDCRTGPKEILLNGKGGLLFKVGDFEDLANKILFFNKNKVECRKMSLKAKKYLDRFDYESNLGKYLKLTNYFI